MSEIRTDNDFFFGSNGVALRPTLVAKLLTDGITTREQAWRTASWLALMGYALPSEQDHPDCEFEDVYAAVRGT